MFFNSNQTPAWKTEETHITYDNKKRRGTMSAALILPYVWAVENQPPARRKSGEHRAEELAFFRRRTEGLLRSYLRASLAVGRVPSIVGDVTLRGRASSYRMKNFEDVVIFTIDVENCLKSLDPQSLRLVVKIALQEYVLLDVAEQLRLDVRTVTRHYGEALDRLTMEFLEKRLLVEGE